MDKRKQELNNNYVMQEPVAQLDPSAIDGFAVQQPEQEDVISGELTIEGSAEKDNQVIS